MQAYPSFITPGMNMSGMPLRTPGFPPQGAPPLYIGNLDETVHEEQLFSHFSKYGTIHSLKIVKDSQNQGRSRGFGYINFMQARDAENARMLAQYDKIGKNPVRLMYKRDVRNNSDANIFVKNIDPNVTFKELHNLFATVGNVLTVKIATNNKGESLGYGYVQMDKKEDAEKALTSLQSRKLKEKEIHCGTFVPKGQREVSNSKNLYIKGLPNANSSEELERSLRGLLEKHGEIISLAARQNKNDGKWFAFACFKDADAADRALALHDTDPLNTGEKLYVNRHQPRHERDQELRKKHLNTKNDTNLFVKNLKPDVTSETLKAAFAQFGDVTSVAVKVNTIKGEEKRAHGFVAFKLSQEASRAQSEGHKNAQVVALFVTGQEVYINFWQPKQQRDQYKHSKNRYNQNFRQPRGPYGNNYMGPAMFPPHPMGYMRMGPGYPMPLIPPPYQRGPGGYRPFNSAAPRGGLGPRKYNQTGGRGPQQQGPTGGHYNQRPNQYVNKSAPANREPYPRNQSRDERKGRPTHQAQVPQQTTPTTTTTQSTSSRAPIQPTAGLEGPHLTVQNLKEKLDDFLKLESDKQRNILGELLFPRIVQKSNNQLAPKITGMLVDFDVLTVQDILEMLEDNTVLDERIGEAVELINQEGEM